MPVVDLNDAILQAHAVDDRKGLIALYTQAADQTLDIDGKCFFLTYAYIYALELGDAAESTLFEQLRRHERV